MADKTISELPVASGIGTSDISVLVSNGTDYQFPFSTLLSFVEANLQVGAKITFGTVVPQNTTGNNGDVFFKTDKRTFYQKTSGTWSVTYTITDNSAADGTLLYGTGIPGSSTGTDNDSYIDTSTGIFYLRTSSTWAQVFSMATGPQGPQGTAGTNGTNGTNGNTVLNGTTNPANTLGNNGDFYINTSNYYLFGPKAAGIWPAGASIVGMAGADGTDGTNGANGTNGTNGNTILNGTSAPDNSLGNNGDFYLDTSDYYLYGPKVAGAWPSGISVVGANGTNGIGVPAGGTTGQVLTKIDGVDYNTRWEAPYSFTGSSGEFVKGDGSYANLMSGDVTAALGLTPFSNPMTTAGDLMIGGVSGTPIRLAAGTNGYLLTIVSGTPEWAAATGDTGTPSGANTQLQYNNSGTFGASAGLSWNNTNQQLIIGNPGTSYGYLMLASSSATPTKIWSRGSGLAFDLDGTGSNVMYWDNNTNGLQCDYITCSSITTGSFSSSLLKIIGREQFISSAGGSTIWYNGMGNGGGLSSTDWSFTNGGSPMLAVKNSNGNILINSGTDDGVNKLQVTGSLAITATNTSVSGSTSGSAEFSMPLQGSIFKKVIVQLISLNGTASYTFPAAFTYMPKVITGNSALATSLSTTAITVTGSTTNDTLILEGY